MTTCPSWWHCVVFTWGWLVQDDNVVVSLRTCWVTIPLNFRPSPLGSKVICCGSVKLSAMFSIIPPSPIVICTSTVQKGHSLGLSVNLLSCTPHSIFALNFHRHEHDQQILYQLCIEQAKIQISFSCFSLPCNDSCYNCSIVSAEEQ